MKKNGVLDIAVRLDFKDMLSELTGQVDAIASTAGKGLSKAASNEISEIKNAIKDLQSEMDKVSYGKVSTKTFEAANKTIISQIENLQKRTTALEVGMKGLVDTMSQAEGGKFAGELANISATMDNLRQNTIDALNVLKQFQDIANKSGGAVNFVNTDNLKDLEEEKNKLEAILGLINGKRKSSVKIETGDFKKLDKVISATTKAYEELDELTSSKKKRNDNKDKILSLQRELATYYSILKDVSNNKDFKITGDIAESFNEEFTLVEKILKKHEASIRERVEEITKTLSSSVSKESEKIISSDGVKYDKDKNKVTVPMKISTSPTSVLKEAEKIIDAVNSNLKKKPLEVEFKLVSAYSSKKTNQALQQLQGEIEALEDGLVKDEFKDIYEKIAKDFNKEISLNVDTKHIKDAAEETKILMSQIQKTLNEKLAIHPRVEFTPEETAMIQASLDKVADNITLTISNITLSDEVKTKLENAVDKKQAEVEKELAKATAKKEKSKKKDTLDTTEAAKLKEITQSIESATGSLAAKLDEINSGSLQPIILSLKQIGQMINVLGQQAGGLPEVFDDITGSLETMLTALQQGLGVKTGGELDAQFNVLKNRVGSIKGDLKDPPKAKTRNPRVEELKEIIRLYKEYQSLGGAKSIENLGGADNVQKWLKKHVNDEIAPKETTEISKVEEAVDNVSKKVDTKNEKFKEEASVVKAVASDEVKSLQNVVDVLQKMFENLAQINQRGFASWKVADWKQAISDALTEIDKVQLKSTENEGLGSIKVQVEPLIDPMEFANRVTSALSGVSAEINIVPSFNPNEIGNEIGKMLNGKVAFNLGNFNDLLEAQKMQQALNSIPQVEGTQRFVRWQTPDFTQRLLSNPNGLSLEKYGVISSIADNLGEAENAAKGLVTYWDRLHQSFGSDMIVMDIPNELAKLYDNVAKAPGFIPQEYIKAVVDMNTAVVTLNNSEQQLSNTINSVTKTTEATQAELLSSSLKDVLTIFQKIDAAIVEATGSFDELVERGFSWNSLTGEHTDFSLTGTKDEFSKAFEYKNQKYKVDSALHTHPEDYVRMSAPNVRDANFGDLIAWYEQWKDGIRTQFIRGLKETLVFDAEQFYSDLRDKLANSNSSLREYVKQVTLGINSNEDYFFKEYNDSHKTELKSLFDESKSKLSVSKDAYATFLENLLSDSEKMSELFIGNAEDIKIGEDFIKNVQHNISNIDFTSGSIKDVIASSLKLYDKESLTEMFGLGDEVKNFIKRFRKILTEGIYELQTGESVASQKRRIYGPAYGEIEEKAFNYVLQNFIKNGKTYADYVKRYDNDIFDSEIWKNYIPKQENNNTVSKTKESTQLAQNESDAFDKISKEAQEASEAKQKFAEANAEVLSSIAQSIGGLGSEAEAFEKISKALKTLTKLPSEKISELALSLLDVREALDTPLGNSTFIDSIKSIVDSGVDFEALSKVLSASQKQIQKAQDIIKGDKTKIVSHNGIKAFLDPTNTVDAKKMAIIEKTARKYADDLGDIVSIQRNVEADRLSYNVKGSNGNNVILGKDSEGGWIVSRQYLKESNSVDKIEEKRYQSEQKAKERERKLIEDQAKAINKAQEKAYNERIKAEEKQQNEYAKLFDEAEKRQNAQIEQMAQGREKAIERANKEKYLSELKQAEAANKAQDKAYADEQKQLRDREALYSKLFDEAEAKQRKFVEDMASGRERISDRSQRDEKAGEIEQAKAINKAQEEAYKKRLQTEEMYAKLFDEAELKRREKEKKQAEAAVKEQEKLDREYGKLFDQAEAKQKKLSEDMGLGRERSNERILKEQRDLELKQAEASNKNLDREYNERLKRIKELDNDVQKSCEKLSSAKTVSKELSPDFVSEIEKAKSELDELYQLIDSHRNGEIFSQEDANRIEEIKKHVDAVQDALKVKANSSSIDKLLQKIGTDLKDNTKMAPELRNRFLLLRESIDGLRKSGEGLDDISLKKFSAEFQHLHEEMIRTGQTGKGFFQSIAEAAKSQTVQFIGRYFSLQDWIRYAQQAFEQVKSIDSALTELRKVSDASTSRLAQNFEASSKAAQDLGHSISGVINITADWARLNITGLIKLA